MTGLIIPKVTIKEEENTPIIKSKPNLLVNLSNIQNKTSSRYTLPKKTLSKLFSLISVSFTRR